MIIPAIASFMVSCAAGGGEPVLVDDFNDNMLDPELWAVVRSHPEQLSIAETNQRIEISSPGNEDASALAVIFNRRWEFDVSADFRFRVDFAYIAPGPLTGDVGIHVVCYFEADVVPGGGDDFTAVIAYVGRDASGNYTGVEHYVDGNLVFEDFDDAGPITIGTVYFAYETAADRMTISSFGYDKPGAAEFFGLRAAAGSQTVGVAIGGYSSAVAPGFAGDTARFDDFVVDEGQLLLGGIGFDEPIEEPALDEPNHEATANFDADPGGFTDVVVTIPGADPKANGFAQVFINNGNAAAPGGNTWMGFDAANPVEVGREPSGVATGRLNDDEHVDAVVANAGDNTLTLLINDGTGVLEPAKETLLVGARPSAVTIADFNVDGFDDIAVTHELDDNVWILFNDGNGGFGKTQQANTGGVMPIGVCPEDLDNDKCVDIVGINRLTGLAPGGGDVGSVFVLFNNNGIFDPAVTFEVGADPKDLAVADVTLDGWPDIMVANAQDATVSILVNQLDRSFVAAPPMNVGGNPRSIAAVDLDGDGDADLAVAADDAGLGPSIQALRNVVEESSDIAFNPPIPFLVNANPNFVVYADLNADGFNDLISANMDTDGRTGGSVTALLNDPIPPLLACPWDLDGSGIVGPEDLIALLGAWGEVDHPADFVDPAGVGPEDLIAMLGNWGPCE